MVDANAPRHSAKIKRSQLRWQLEDTRQLAQQFDSVAMEKNLTLCVPRVSVSNLDPHRDQPVIVETPRPNDCPPYHVLIRVDRFGFSTNNVTYQALGEHPHFRYFDFHPAPETETISAKTHGVVPVWGFGVIIASGHPRIKPGERVYGYLAPTRYLLVPVSKADVNKHAFYVLRPDLPPDRRPYNQILRCAADPQYVPNQRAEDLTMLYRPLFWTAYWFEDSLFYSGYRGGAKSVIVSSASSKTAFCLAYLIRKRSKKHGAFSDVQITGLTSKRNVRFTERLGLYHRVIDYEAFESNPGLLRTGKRTIYVDVAGKESLNALMSRCFDSSSLAAWISLGLTNIHPSSEANALEWNATSASTPFSDAKYASSFSQEHFFMPEWLDVRKRQLVPDEIFKRQNEAWKELMADCDGWVKFEHVHGPDEVKKSYESIVKGDIGPEKGLVWSLWSEEEVARDATGRAKL